MKFFKIVAALLAVILLLPTVTACTQKVQDPSPHARSYYEYFDTVSTVFSYAGDTEAEFLDHAEAVTGLLWDYHRLFDIYHEYSGVDNLMTVNKNAGVAPVEVDERLIDFLLYAKEMYTLTGGKMNVAMGSVLKLWHDRRTAGISNPKSARLPSEAELTAAAQHTDINDLIIDEKAGTVYLADPEMRLDVGALGKGYATEKAAQLLIDRGVSSYVLNIGGNIRAIGTKPSGAGWSTGITNPDRTSSDFAMRIELSDTSCVTSGDYERYYTVDGVRYHHITDPDTLYPAAYFSSVTVITPDSALADALSTALFCMSYEEGLSLVESIGGIDVIWIDRDGVIKTTDGVVRID